VTYINFALVLYVHRCFPQWKTFKFGSEGNSNKQELLFPTTRSGIKVKSSL